MIWIWKIGKYEKLENQKILKIQKIWKNINIKIIKIGSGSLHTWESINGGNSKQFTPNQGNWWHLSNLINVTNFSSNNNNGQNPGSEKRKKQA